MAKIVKVGAVVSIGVIVLIVAFSLYDLQQSRQEFSQSLRAIQKEKENIQRLLQEKEEALVKVNQQLAQLQYPQRLRESLLSAQELVRKLNADLKSLKQENAALQNANIARQNRLQNYTQKMESLVDELKESKQRVIELQRAIEEEKKKAGRYRSRQEADSSLSQDMENLRAKYRALEKEKNMLRQRLLAEEGRRAEPASQRNEALIAKLKAAVADRNEQIRAMRQELVQLEYLKKREEDLTSLKGKLQAQVSSLVGELEAKQGEIGRLQEAFNQVKAEKEKTVEAVTKELTQLKDSYAAIADERDTLKKKEKELNSVNADLQEQVSGLFAALKTKEKQIRILQEDFKQAKAFDEKKLQSLAAELSVLTERYAAIEQERDSLKQKEEQLNKVNAGLENKLAELSAVIKARESEIARLEDDLKEAKARGAEQVERITAELKAMEERYNEYDRQMSALKLKQRALATRNGQLEKRITELSDILNIKENEIALTKERFEQMRSLDAEKLKSLRDELNQLKNQHETVQNERNSLKQKEEVLSALNRKLQQQVGELFTKLKDKESEIAMLQQKFEQARTMGLEKVAAITQELQEIQSRYTEFQRQRDELERREEELRGSNALLQDQVFELSETLKNKQNEINLLQESFKQAKKIDAQKIEDLTHELNNLQRLYSRIDREKTKSGLKEQAIGTLADNLQKQISILSKALKEKELETSRLAERFQKVRSADSQQLERARQALTQLRQRYAAIERERNALVQKEAQLHTFNTNLQKQVLELSQQLDEKNRQLSQLKQGLDVAPVGDSSALESLQQRIRSQDAELQKVTSLYLRLKDQLQKIGGQLSEKEAELAAKEREAKALRKDINHLKSSADQWGAASIETGQEQDYLIEELSRALDLKERLQERLNEVSAFVEEDDAASADTSYTTLDDLFQPSSAGSEDISFSGDDDYKDRVEKLKKEVEVILQRVEGAKQK